MMNKNAENTDPDIQNTRKYFQASLNQLPLELHQELEYFFLCYQDASQKNPETSVDPVSLFCDYAQQILKQINTPYSFHPYHEQVRYPFDHYRFGQDFIQPLIDKQHSSFDNQTQIQQIRAQLNRGENVILLANHQIEADPQAISFFVEKYDPLLAREMIFVAGHRVTTDPFAVPFSLGRNLLCIYSKRYIDHPPELKATKIQHNQKALRKLSELFNQGGKCIYVAPSGGRDRPSADGYVRPAAFDPDSMEMFHLLANHSKNLCHFYPLALATYALLPPPQAVQIDLGEKRSAHYAPIHMALGDPVDFKKQPVGTSITQMDKQHLRQLRAELVWHKICALYQAFPLQKAL